MRQVWVLACLHVLCICSIFAQEDSLHIKRSFGPEESKDMLFLIDPDPLGEWQSNIFVTPQTNVNLAFGKGSSSKNIFNSSYSRFIVPSALIAYGVAAQFNEGLRNFDLGARKEVIGKEVKVNLMDDYTQFAPALAVYGLDFLGVKAKHSFVDRTIVMATSYLIMGATVQTVKRTVRVERPNGASRTSFPSGHTATVFVGAHILYKEYKDVSPWIGVAGYLVAANTGFLRVMNNRHWFSDVMAGAGVGILSAELGYMLLPVFKRMTGIKDSGKSLVVAPVIGNGSYEVGLSYTF